LIRERQTRLRAALRTAPFEAVLLTGGPDVAYASGYRSLPAEIYPRYQIAAVVTEERCVVVAPCGDVAAALAAGLAPDDFVAFGQCYYESEDGSAPETLAADAHATFAEAMSDVAARLTLSRQLAGVDASNLSPDAAAVLQLVVPEACRVDAAHWIQSVRAIKTAQEIACLRTAAELAERGIQRALLQAGAGCTEQQVAAIIGQTMLEGGGTPRFLSVQVGDRAALGDAFATAKAWRPGELLRMDVGCSVDGYWSDLARTAVLGDPTALQRRRFDALLAGQEAELAAVRPGARAADLFNLAIAAAREAGLPGYRRHHCGHGIGLEIYEPPMIGPANDVFLERDMVLCLETPFYEVGWGGILTEDTLVVTDDGSERFTTSARDLRVVAL
jgi:Xaa-Pro aminopeptidase